eukprot:COSAG06_NODE_2195_length_7378_cov_11.570271_3_plen_50_part_00
MMICPDRLGTNVRKPEFGARQVDHEDAVELLAGESFPLPTHIQQSQESV